MPIRKPNFALCVFFIAVLATSIVPAVAGSCPDLSAKIDRETAQLNELMVLREELNEKFQGEVANDFTAQSEGLLDEIHRSAAIKVVFARKKLTKNIEAKKLTLMGLKSEYCSRCSADFRNETSKKSYCDKCPVRPECGGSSLLPAIDPN